MRSPVSPRVPVTRSKQSVDAAPAPAHHHAKQLVAAGRAGCASGSGCVSASVLGCHGCPPGQMPARLHLIKVWRGYSKVKMTCLTTHRTNVRTCGWPPLESTRWQDTRLAGPYASRPDGGISCLSRARMSRRWDCQSQVRVGGQGASARRTLHPAAGNVAMLHLPLLVTAPVPILFSRVTIHAPHSCNRPE